MKRSVRVTLALVFSLIACHGVQARSPDAEWTKTLRGNGAWSVQQAVDGGYILTGEIYHGSGHQGLHLIRTTSSGDTLWTRSVGGAQYGVYAGGRSGTECFDGSIVAAGYRGLDVYVVKTNSDGDTLWTRKYRGYIAGYSNESTCVRETLDHSYIISGFSAVFGAGDDALVIKLDQNGNQEFLNRYGGAQFERANAIIQTPDGGYIAVGSRRFSGTVDWYDQFWILKTTSAGGQEWTRVYGGPATDVATAVCRTGDGGYLVAGYTNSNGAGDYDFHLMKLSSAGDSLWTRTYGSARSERCYSMTQTADDRFVLVGTRSGSAFSSKVLAVSINADGDTLWTKQIPEVTTVVANGYAVGATEDRSCVIAGSTGTYNANTYLVKLAPDLTPVDERGGLPARYELRQNLPNPFNPLTSIEFSVPTRGLVILGVFDVAGRRVTTLVNEVKEPGVYTVQLDGSNLASGVYFGRLTAGSFMETKKMVLLK